MDSFDFILYISITILFVIVFLFIPKIRRAFLLLSIFQRMQYCRNDLSFDRINSLGFKIVDNKYCFNYKKDMFYIQHILEEFKSYMHSHFFKETLTDNFKMRFYLHDDEYTLFYLSHFLANINLLNCTFADEEPLEFIKVVCSKQSANYPVYHYVRQSGLSISEVISVIAKVPSRNKGKESLIERLQGKMVEQTTISTAGGIAAEKKRHYKAMWLNEQIPEAIEDHNYCLEALKALSEDEIRAHDGYIRTQLLRIFAEIYENASGNLASTLRKAICRVDEVLNS